MTVIIPVIIMCITILAVIILLYSVRMRARGKIQSSLHIERFHPVVVPMGKVEFDADCRWSNNDHKKDNETNFNNGIKIFYKIRCLSIFHGARKKSFDKT